MRICDIENCTKKHKAKGFCKEHYEKYRRYGDPLLSKTERHGMTHSPEYQIWKNIRCRCYYKNNIDYKYYGGCGITVCDSWKNSFKNFYTDMGKRPFPKAELSRIDNDGNYEPSNCRWVTHKVSCQNRKPYKKKVLLEPVIVDVLKRQGIIK